MEDVMKLRGDVHMVLRNENGEVIDTRDFQNLIVTTGHEHVADQLCGTPSQLGISHMAVGTGTTAANIADTALETELVSRALDTGYPTLHETDLNKVVYKCTYPAGSGTGSLTEAGLLNADGTPVLLARQVFATLSKGASDILEITWTITVG